MKEKIWNYYNPETFTQEQSDNEKKRLWEEILNLTDKLMFLEHNYPGEVHYGEENKEEVYQKRGQLQEQYQAILDYEGLDVEE